MIDQRVDGIDQDQGAWHEAQRGCMDITTVCEAGTNDYMPSRYQR